VDVEEEKKQAKERMERSKQLEHKLAVSHDHLATLQR
jgi:hypothetical protein